MSSRAAACHRGLLLGLRCRVEDGSWRRVCEQCLAVGSVELPASRCRLLPNSLGVFSPGRTFYVRWVVEEQTVARVRPFPLANSHSVLLIFPTEEDIRLCEEALPPGRLLRAQPEHCRLRMCAHSKSFCPQANFYAVGAASCALHVANRLKRPSDAEPATASETELAAALETSSDVPLEELLHIVEGSLAEPRDGPSHASTLPSALLSSSSALPSNENTLPSALPSLSSALPSHASPLPPALPLPSSAPPAFASGLGASGQGFGAAEPYPPFAVVEATPCGPHAPCSTATRCDSLHVSSDLFAGGQTVKAGGSAMWTVVSDARLKEVVGDFPLGVDEVMQLRPYVPRGREPPVCCNLPAPGQSPAIFRREARTPNLRMSRRS